jgi:hypothetical protein
MYTRMYMGKGSNFVSSTTMLQNSLSTCKQKYSFLDSFLQEGIRQSLKIFIKQFNILEVQGMAPFQMTCCLCEWGIIANSFPASSSPLLESSSSSHQHDRTFVFRTIYQTLGYCTFTYTHYLRCRSHGFDLRAFSLGCVIFYKLQGCGNELYSS